MHLIIIDDSNPMLSEHFDQLILWQSYREAAFPDAVSIPVLVEKNANNLRSRYLKLIYDLGEVRVQKTKLYDSLELRPGLSYWWTTLVAEKCNFAKSPLITDVVRLFAFDQWAADFHGIKSMKLISANPELHECLKNWCEAKGIHFECHQLAVKTEAIPALRQVFNRLPHTIQAVFWLLKYLIDRWPLRGAGIEDWKKVTTSVTFISYLFNLQPKAARVGRFESNYWTELPNVLVKQKIQSSWLHIYVKNSVTPTAKSAAKLLQNFNAHHKGDQVHVALDSFLNIKSVVGAIKDYLNIKRISRLSTYTVSKCFVKDSQLMESLLWPLFKNDWERSFFGIDAISNLLMLNLFEQAFLDLPKQQKGVYLQENQGWEFGMIHAWQANGHGRLTGFPHSTVRFWDLRHFFDPRSYSRKRTAVPMPDFVAVSGDTVKDAYINGGYPVEDLIEVEALRYHYLSEFDDNLIRSRLSSPKPLKLLVLGDHVSSNTAMQMNYLKGIVEELSNIELTIKPHPACPIADDDYPELQFKLSNQPLPELLGLCDVAYTSTTTSAAVDAYSVGLRVISVLDPANLNLSPLRGIAGVRFVSSAEELREALLEATLQSDEGGKRVNYFNVDSSLPRWQALLLSKPR